MQCMAPPLQGQRVLSMHGQVACSRSSQLAPRRASRSQALVVRAQGGRSDGGFSTGFLVGGIVGGFVGFLFAPQISRAILGEDQKIKLPKFETDESSTGPEIVTPEAIKGELTDKINVMNTKIDELTSRLQDSNSSAEQLEIPKQTASS